MARSSELEPADISTIAWALAKMGFGSDVSFDWENVQRPYISSQVLFQRLARVVEVTTHLFSGSRPLVLNTQTRIS